MCNANSALPTELWCRMTGRGITHYYELPFLLYHSLPALANACTASMAHPIQLTNPSPRIHTSPKQFPGNTLSRSNMEFDLVSTSEPSRPPPPSASSHRAAERARHLASPDSLDASWTDTKRCTTRPAPSSTSASHKRPAAVSTCNSAGLNSQRYGV